MAPAGLNAVFDRLADKLHATKSHAARQAILDALEANGVQLVDRHERRATA